jgi:hypothetical protein
MATITTRSGKGSPLTNTEVDDKRCQSLFCYDEHNKPDG